MRDPVAGTQRAERSGPRPDRIDQEAELALASRCETLIGRGSSRPGASSMKNCPGIPASVAPRSTRRSVYGPTGLGRDDAYAVRA